MVEADQSWAYNPDPDTCLSKRLDPSQFSWHYQGPSTIRQKGIGKRYRDVRQGIDPRDYTWTLAPETVRRYARIETEEKARPQRMTFHKGRLRPEGYHWVNVPTDPVWDELERKEEERVHDGERAETATIRLLIKRYCTATALDQFGMTPQAMKRAYGIDIEAVIAEEKPRMQKVARRMGLHNLAMGMGVGVDFFRKLYDILERKK